MNIDINKIKEDVIEYLNNNIQKTPDEFKKLIDCIVKFYKDCGINLGILISQDFDSWGECWGLRIRIVECRNLLAHIAENESLVLSMNTIGNYLNEDIHKFVFEFLMKNYQEVVDGDDDDLCDQLYDEIYDALEADEKFNEHKNNYFYTLIARRLKENIESMIEKHQFAEKTDEYHALPLIHNNRTIINFGVKFNIH